MKILKDSKLIDYNDDLYINNQKIDFQKGKKAVFSKKAKYIIPGYIDQHIHGGYEIDTMDNDHNKISILAKKIINEGVTSFLPTTMTQDLDLIKNVISNVKKASFNKEQANIIGIHLEGPFISKDFIGAQNPKYVINPSIEKFKELNKDSFIKLVTYAPENDQDFKFARYLKEQNIKLQIGHSGASCEICKNALENGVDGLTHFHNAASKYDHRKPGIINFGLYNKEVKSEIIADLIHLDKDVLEGTYQIKGAKNIILITDAMRAKSLEDGKYDLGGQVVIKKDNKATLKNGVLAGSILTMDNAVKNFIKNTSAKINEVFEMASKNVAIHLNIKNKGIIKKGYDFDVISLDKDYNVLDVYVLGKKLK